MPRDPLNTSKWVLEVFSPQPWGRPLSQQPSGNAKSPAPYGCGALQSKSGDVLLSQEAYLQVPSALTSLTTVFGMGTGVTSSLWPPKPWISPVTVKPTIRLSFNNSISEHEHKEISSPRPISTGQLKPSRVLHIRPINVVIYNRPYQVNPVGDLILRRASHLDAFSAYPFRR